MRDVGVATSPVLPSGTEDRHVRCNIVDGRTSSEQNQVMESYQLKNHSSVEQQRRTKFTPQNIRQIINLVERGTSPEQIADIIGVTLGTLRVTCSKLQTAPFL